MAAVSGPWGSTAALVTRDVTRGDATPGTTWIKEFCWFHLVLGGTNVAADRRWTPPSPSRASDETRVCRCPLGILEFRNLRGGEMKHPGM